MATLTTEQALITLGFAATENPTQEQIKSAYEQLAIKTQPHTNLIGNAENTAEDEILCQKKNKIFSKDI